MTPENVHCNLTQMCHSKQFGQKSHSEAFTSEQRSVLAEVTSMSAQFIISRPLTPPVYGPRIKKAHSEHTEKGKRSAVRALNIQLVREGGTEAKWRCVPVLHVTLLISCLTDYIQLNGFKCSQQQTGGIQGTIERAFPRTSAE